LHSLAFSNKRINFFSLDVEGSENLVLKTIDFSKVMIDVIMIEIQNQHCRGVCEVREQVRQKMSTEGYLRYEGLIPKSDIYSEIRYLCSSQEPVSVAHDVYSCKCTFRVAQQNKGVVVWYYESKSCGGDCGGGGG